MNWMWILLAAFSTAASSTPDAPRTTPGTHEAASIALQRAAIAQQRASIRKQAANLSLWMIPWEDGPPPIEAPVCAPIAEDVVAPIIDSAAKAQNVAPKLIRAVIEQESGLRPCAVSSKGAQGLMQIMPDTAQNLQVQDPFDPGQNIQAGAKYLKQLLDKYKGDVPQALAAYNAGPKVVDAAGGIPPIQETQGYVDAILEKLGIKRTANQQ